VRLAVARFPAKNLNLFEQEEDINQRVAASKQESTQVKELEHRERETENMCACVCVFYLNTSMWLMIGGGSAASRFLVGVLFS
jgi:hypothetical protein